MVEKRILNQYIIQKHKIERELELYKAGQIERKYKKKKKPQ